MTLRTVYAVLELEFEYLGRREAGKTVQQILVDGLNDPDSGLRIVQRPCLTLRRSAS